MGSPAHRSPKPFQQKTVKLDSRETPPPLHYSPTPSDLERVSPRETTPRETTPISTPKGFGPGYPRKSDGEKDLLFSWHRNKADHFGGLSGLYVDSALLESDLEDSTFPLFGSSPDPDAMITSSYPIGIATQSRSSPVSPRPQTSNLTSALQTTTEHLSKASPSINNGFGIGKAGRKESFGAGFSGLTSQYGGAQPISMNGSNRDHPRRESFAGSLAGGMSWGGVSVGSWIRDEYVHSLMASSACGCVYLHFVLSYSEDATVILIKC